MRVNMAPQPTSEDTGEQADLSPERPKSDTLLAYEGRRCHVCRCASASFGFGVPLSPGAQEIWACRAHRDIVDRMLRGERVSQSPPRSDPGKLL